MRLIHIIITVLNLVTNVSSSTAINKEWYMQGFRKTKMNYINASTRLTAKAALSPSKSTAAKAGRNKMNSSKAPGKGRSYSSTVAPGKGIHPSKALGKGIHSSKAPGKGIHSSKAPGKGSHSFKVPGTSKDFTSSKSGKNQTSTMVSNPKGPKHEEQDSSVKDIFQLSAAQSSLANGADKSDAYNSRSIIGCYVLMVTSCVAAIVFL